MPNIWLIEERPATPLLTTSLGEEMRMTSVE
jgi:hypothetical protein